MALPLTLGGHCTKHVVATSRIDAMAYVGLSIMVRHDILLVRGSCTGRVVLRDVPLRDTNPTFPRKN